MLYAVESFRWRGAGDMDVTCVAPNWITFNAWDKARKLWNKMNRRAMSETNIDPGTWSDFKVFMNAAHYVSTAGGTTYNTNLQPEDGNGVDYSVVGAEWDYSLFVSPTAAAGVSTTNACHMLGADSAVNNAAINCDGSHAIIQGYADTRTTVFPQEPEVPGDAAGSWVSQLFDMGDTQTAIINDLEVDNDQPPYGHALDAPAGDNPIYPGGSESAVNGMQLAVIAPVATETVYAPGGDVPCGLLFVSPSTAGELTVTVAPGRYKGVGAMRMQDVKT